MLYFGYKLLGVIGEGTYGQVFKACKAVELDREPWIEFGPAIYAVKRQKVQGKPQPTTTTTSEQQQQQNAEAAPPPPPETSFSVTLLREIKLLRELQHGNIVQMVDCQLGGEREDTTTLVFEYAEFEMMKMIDFYKNQQRALPEYTVKSFLYQSLRGVAHLHENWVIHRDLKPDNILIMGGEGRRGNVVLADLGLARIFRNPTLPMGRVDKVVVTLWYRAPELLLGAQHYTPAVDMWSMGCIFAALLLAKEQNIRALFQGSNKEGAQNPFQSDQAERIFRVLGYPNAANWPEVETMEHFKSIVHRKRASEASELRAHFPAVSENCFNLLSRMLELNPAKRISAKDALQHSYFSSLPRPGENALDEPHQQQLSASVRKERNAIFAQFEQQSLGQGIKPLDFAQAEAQNAQIEARRRELREAGGVSQLHPSKRWKS